MSKQYKITIAEAATKGARQKGKKMYKIVWLGSNVEPVVGFRTDNIENAKKLVDAWNINFSSNQEVVEA